VSGLGTTIRGAGWRGLVSEIAGLLLLKTTAGFLIVAVGFLFAVMPWIFKSRAIVVAVTFNSCAIKRWDLPALTPIAINLRRSAGEILGVEFLSEGFISPLLFSVCGG
jgi:hypothetical protein